MATVSSNTQTIYLIWLTTIKDWPLIKDLIYKKGFVEFALSKNVDHIPFTSIINGNLML